jgi:hypothetical protein
MPSRLLQRGNRAYNARDVDALAALYAEDFTSSFGRRLPPPRIRHLALDDFDVERIKYQPEVRKFARTSFANYNCQGIIVFLGCDRNMQ